MGNTPQSPTQTAPSGIGKKISEQNWFKWCEVLVTIWGVLTLIYGGLQHFLKFAPVWDVGAGAPRWFDIILTYFCFPVAVLGVYSVCFAVVAFVLSLVTNRPGANSMAAVIGVIIGTVVLVYGLTGNDTPGAFLWLPFIFGLGCIYLFVSVVRYRARQRRYAERVS